MLLFVSGPIPTQPGHAALKTLLILPALFPDRPTHAARHILGPAKRLGLTLLLVFAVGMLLTQPGRVAVMTLLILPELSRERVDEILAGMPPRSRERLAAISPSREIATLKARLYLLHGRADPLIPLSQARRLAAEAPPGTLRLDTETDLFKDVTPDTQAHPLLVARSLPTPVRHAWLVAQEFI